MKPFLNDKVIRYKRDNLMSEVLIIAVTFIIVLILAVKKSKFYNN